MIESDRPIARQPGSPRRFTTRAERRRRTLTTLHRALRAAPTPLERAEIVERYRRLADPVTRAA